MHTVMSGNTNHFLHTEHGWLDSVLLANSQAGHILLTLIAMIHSNQKGYSIAL